MSNIQEVIIHCCEVLKAGTDEVNSITPILLEIYSNLDNLPAIFALNQQTEDSYVRNQTIIGIKNIIRPHLKAHDLPEELLNFIKTSIVQGLQMEIGEESKQWYCIIAGLIVDYIGASQYPEIIELATSFVQDELQLQTGLLLWTQICSSLNPEDVNAHMETFIQIIVAILNGENGNFRILAMQLFQNVVDRSNNYESLANSEELQLALQNAYDRVINSECTENERLQVIGTLADILRTDDTFDVINPSFKQLYHITMNAIFNQELPTLTRLDTLDFFNQVIAAKPDSAESILEEIIQAIVPLTVDQCTIEGRENFEPHFSDTTLQILAGDDAVADDLIATILGYAQETIESDPENFTQIQVLIQFFDPLAAGARERILPYEPDITPVFHAALTNGDECLISATCLTLQAIADECPSFFYPQFGSYVEIIIQLYEQEQGLPTLEKLLSIAESPIANTTEICGNLMSIPSQSSDVSLNAVIQCISACLSNSNQANADPDLYPAIKEFLLACLESDPETNETVYECFSNCCQIAPQLVLADLEYLFESMAQLINEETLQYIGSVCRAIGNFSHFFPISTAPYVAQCAQAMIPFLVNDTKQTNALSKDEEISNEETKEISLQGSIMLCLSTFASSAPEAAGEFIEPLINLINEWVTSSKDEDENKVCFAADCISEIASGLRVLDIDPLPLLNHLLSALQSPTDVDITNNLFTAFANLLVQIAEKINEETINKIFTFFCNVLSGENQDFSSQEGQIDMDLQDGFFFALKSFIVSGLITKVDPSPLIESLLSKLSQQNDPNLSALSVLALSRFAYINAAGTDEIAQQCIQSIITLLNQDEIPVTVDIKNRFYSALSYLSLAHFTVFEQELVENLASHLSQDLTDEESEKTIKLNSALAIISIAANGVDIVSETLNTAIALMPPDYDEEDAALYSRAALALNATRPDLLPLAAVQTLASQDWVLNLIPQEMIPPLVETVKTLPETTIQEPLHNNEGAIHKLSLRLA